MASHSPVSRTLPRGLPGVRWSGETVLTLERGSGPAVGSGASVLPRVTASQPLALLVPQPSRVTWPRAAPKGAGKGWLSRHVSRRAGRPSDPQSTSAPVLENTRLHGNRRCTRRRRRSLGAVSQTPGPCTQWDRAARPGSGGLTLDEQVPGSVTCHHVSESRASVTRRGFTSLATVQPVVGCHEPDLLCRAKE